MARSTEGLAEFLLARIVEDSEVLRPFEDDIVGREPPPISDRGFCLTTHDSDGEPPTIAVHPFRLLVECQVKRDIIRACQRTEQLADRFPTRHDQGLAAFAATRQLALPHSSRKGGLLFYEVGLRGCRNAARTKSTMPASCLVALVLTRVHRQPDETSSQEDHQQHSAHDRAQRALLTAHHRDTQQGCHNEDQHDHRAKLAHAVSMRPPSSRGLATSHNPHLPPFAHRTTALDCSARPHCVAGLTV